MVQNSRRGVKLVKITFTQASLTVGVAAMCRYYTFRSLVIYLHIISHVRKQVSLVDRNGVKTVNEIIFLVEEAPEGGYTARALGESIFTEADDSTQLQDRVRDAVRCHFDEEDEPQVIRLHFVREEIIAL